MKARIWGCRGSLSTPGAATVRYGGNTSCVEVRTSTGCARRARRGHGHPLARRVARQPSAPAELDLLLTHLHLDHIEGLGFFAPLFDPECTIRDLGAAAGGRLARGS